MWGLAMSTGSAWTMGMCSKSWIRLGGNMQDEIPDSPGRKESEDLL